MIFATYSNLDRYLQPPQSDDSNALVETKPKSTPSQRDLYFPSDGLVDSSSGSSRHGEKHIVDDIETDIPTVSYDAKKPHDDLYGKNVNTRIISASVGGRSSEEQIPLQEPVIYTLEHQTVRTNVLPMFIGTVDFFFMEW